MVSRDKEYIKKIHIGTSEIKNKMAEMKNRLQKKSCVNMMALHQRAVCELCPAADTYVIGVPRQEELGMKNIWRTMSIKKNS